MRERPKEETVFQAASISEILEANYLDLDLSLYLNYFLW
jgi:hypothetical protein